MIRRFFAAAAALLLSGTALAVDGDAVYVRAAGGSDAYSGLTPADPVATIARGHAVAASSGRRKLHLAGGSYPSFTMVNGVDVIGGFDQQFLTAGTQTTVIYAQSAAANSPSVVITATAINQPTRLAGLQLVMQSAIPGRNAIGLLIRNSTSTLVAENLQIVGSGANAGAAAGAHGGGASSTPAAAGAPGIRAGSLPGGCTTSVSAAAPAAPASRPAAAAARAGANSKAAQDSRTRPRARGLRALARMMPPRACGAGPAARELRPIPRRSPATAATALPAATARAARRAMAR